MLVFIDESGDTGLKVDQGSSAFFVVSLVIFDDHDEAYRCDQRINLLRYELGLRQDYEFHFKHNSNSIRESFLQAISPYQFIYFSVVVDKDPNRLWGQGFQVKESFYKYACNMAFTLAKPYIENATVIIDRSGSSTFASSLKKYLERKTTENNKKNAIKKIKAQKSHGNNLLQLADYISGVINRKVQDKKDWKQFYKYISTKELKVQTWPPG